MALLRRSSRFIEEMALSNAVVSQICKGVQRGATARSMAGAPRTFSVVHNQVEEDVAAVDYTIDDDGFATVTLAQPDRFNTMSDGVIKRLDNVFSHLSSENGVRAAFVRSTGKIFCAGADLTWMKKTASYTREQNLADAEFLGRMLSTIDRVPFPTVALVQGPCFGGGVGLVSVCDIAVGTPKVSFTLSEVKLGLLPATISPYVVRRMGEAQARRYFLTAEKIDADSALAMGILHELVDNNDGLDEWEGKFRKAFTVASPTGIAATKDLISAVAGREITPALIKDTARRLCDQRASPEGVEGLTAFFEKRNASWNRSSS